MITISHPKSLYVESKDFLDRKGSSYERIALIALQRWSKRFLLCACESSDTPEDLVYIIHGI